MKHILAVSIAACTLFMFAGCTDNDLANPDIPAHCSDGVQNNGEQDVDCGGECSTCTTLESPCNPDTNSVVYAGSQSVPFPNGTYTYTSIFGDPDSDNYEVIAYHNTMEVDIKWHGARPTQQRVYQLGGTYYLNGFYNENQANIRLWHQLTGAKAVSTGGKLYAKPLPNGKLLLTFCDVQFVSEVSTSTVVYSAISGRIKVPQ